MKKIITFRISKAQERKIQTLVEQGFGRTSNILRDAIDAAYDMSHAPFDDRLLLAEDRLRTCFIELSRERAKEISDGWVDVVTGKVYDAVPRYYTRYRDAFIKDHSVEDFLKENDFLEPIR